MAKRRGKVNFEAPGTNLSEAKERVMGQGVQASGRGVHNRHRDSVEQFAEEIGRLLGTAERTVEEWLEQRQAVTQRLTAIRDTANQLLSRLASESGAAADTPSSGRPPRQARRRPGRPAGSGKKKRTMSPEARERIAAAQRARWAEQRKGAAKA